MLPIVQWQKIQAQDNKLAREIPKDLLHDIEEIKVDDYDEEESKTPVIILDTDDNKEMPNDLQYGLDREFSAATSNSKDMLLKKHASTGDVEKAQTENLAQAA